MTAEQCRERGCTGCPCCNGEMRELIGASTMVQVRKLAEITKRTMRTLGVGATRHQAQSDFEIGDSLPGDVIEIEKTATTPRGLRAEGVCFVERPVVASEPQTATIVDVMSEKGYAFCLVDGETDNTFFHRSATPHFDSLQVGDRIRGLIKTTRRGPRLESIERI